MERLMGAGGELWGALERGAVVVTANERAAREVWLGWDVRKRSTGAARWEPATAMSWPAWTSSLWRRLLLGGTARSLLLNRFQELTVWRRVVEEDKEARELRGLDGLAEMAAEAWAALWAYAEPGARRGGVAGMLRAERGRDAAVFARWAGAFERRCREEALVSGAELEARLGEAVRAGELKPGTDELLLVGFDRLLPAQERMVAELQRAGVAVAHAAGGVAGGKQVLTEAADADAEARACARWVAKRLAGGGSGRIALIVPDQASERAGLERVFREVLAPEMEWIGESEAGAPFEFSLGRPLREVQMVRVALELLRWVEGALPLERVSRLMVSDYFAHREGEREVRAAFDAYEVRRAGALRPEITITGVTRMVTGSRRAGSMPALAAALRRMERTAFAVEGVVQGYGLWAESFGELLEAAEWGAADAETSEEFQARRRWESALDAVATLDFEGRVVDYGEALAALERVARATIFAPESGAAAVQVMGALEAAGSEFDAVWFLRAGELSWPPEPRPPALLSWELKRGLALPGTDEARDLKAARVVTERVLRSGGDVVVSYAAVLGGTRQRASAPVRAMGLDIVTAEELAGPEPVREPAEIEQVEDAGVSVALPDRPVSGGARVLELQAACGFRAFAEQRLASAELEERALGLDAREGGVAVHRALECFWEEIGSQETLLALSYAEEQAAILRAIERALGDRGTRSGGAWEAAYVSMQRERLRRLLSRWMKVEKSRTAFSVMRREAEMRDARVGPLRLKLRMDRVDVVDETHVLIDYKTGKAMPTAWEGERPDSPQVPLYAVLASGTGGDALPLGAVAFGSVRAGKEARLRGFAAREGLLPGKPPKMEGGSFEAQVDLWRGRLERLAEEFAAGGAEVRPKSYPATCGRCGQRVLCRLDPSLVEEIDEQDEERDGADG